MAVSHHRYIADHHRDSGHALFVFGSLMDKDILSIVLDREPTDVAVTDAVVRGFQRRRVSDEFYPVLVPRPDGTVVGRLVEGLSADDLERVHFYEGDVYELAPVHATTTCGRRETANVFLDAGDLKVSREGWDFDAWHRHEKQEALALTTALMRYYGRISLREVEGVWNEIKDQAESLFAYDEEAMAAEAKAYP
ncbi:gamma-glutamylcyclotransferase family protein [Caenispirillum salinarum]|uniref:gamma-glutamylcyclotransferase family protein n=1 Tax=Caenispirillum salinarum TaxID=859058 RepID=UPI00384ED45D